MKLKLYLTFSLLLILLMAPSSYAQDDAEHTRSSAVILADHAANVTLLLTLEGHLEAVRDVAFSPDSEYLVSGGEDLSVKLWRIASGGQIYSRELHAGFVTDVDFTILDDGSWLMASVGWDRVAMFQRIPPDDPGQVENAGFFEGASAVLNRGSFNSDGSRYAFNAGTGVIFLLQTADFTELSRFVLDGLEGSALAFSPDGRWLGAAAGFPSAGAYLFDIRSAGGEAPLELPHEAVVTGLAFDPTIMEAPLRLAMVTEDGFLRLWEITDEVVEIGQTRQQPTWYMSLAYHPSGELVAAATLNGTIELWDVREPDNLHLLRTLDGHEGYPIYGVAFSPDGTLLASAGGDKTIRLWGLPLD